MLTCPICGFRNPDANDTCFRCSAILKRNPELVEEAIERADRKHQLYARRQLWAAPLERFFESRFYERLNALPDDDRYRYPFTAGLLSIILPGLGHFYVGQPLKGVIFAGTGILFIIAALITIHATWSNYLLFAMLVFWTSAWGSSLAAAMRANGATLVRRHIYALFFAGIMLLGFFMVVGQYLGLGFISLEKITAKGMAPSLVQGERVAFSAVPLWFRDPRVNEIIKFDPPRFNAQIKSDSISINIKRYYQRLLGVGGDHLKKVGDQIWRNGQLLKPDQLPFGLETMGDFEFTVPADRYYAPITRIPEADMLAAMWGAPDVPYIGADGYVFSFWDGYPYITEDMIWAKGLAIIDPPPRRQWLP